MRRLSIPRWTRVPVALAAAWLLPAPATGGGGDCMTAEPLPPGALACDGDVHVVSSLGMAAATPSGAGSGVCWDDGTVDGDTWYRWTNDTGQVAYFGASTDYDANWYSDSQISIYTDCPGTVEVACNEWQQPGNELALAGLVAIAPGETAYIQFDGFAGDRGFELATFLCWPCQLEAPFEADVNATLFALKLDDRDVAFPFIVPPDEGFFSVEENRDAEFRPATRIAVSISTSLIDTDALVDSSPPLVFYQVKKATLADCR